MPFESGARLGPYEIVSPLGEGGMGAVYRARDTRLERTVAIKVLTRALAADPEFRTRLEAEARAIAALNDPHICTIHDVGREGELDYLVLEYLEGETLLDRIRRTGPMSVPDAVAIAVQIGEGLQRAHRTGIVHRDLKPGNVMLIARGGATVPHVKLLDFGLAARTATTKPPAIDASLEATVAPTMVATRPPPATSPATATGVGLSGTLQYLAPEQIDGQAGDQRADIFAFGCVLYEMLAGQKAFQGNSAMTVIAAIMSSEPAPIVGLAASHPAVDHVLRRCLEKDPERRWQDIGDVTRELQWAASQPVIASAAPAAPVRKWGPGHWFAAGLAAVFALVVVLPLALLGGLKLIGADRDDAPTQALQLEVTTPSTDDISGAVSPDGMRIAFVAIKDHVPMLWVRQLDKSESDALPGTQGASFPFWSPDNKSLGFFADNKLKRIDVAGGTPTVITDAPTARGGAWGPDGTILFAPGVSAPIKRVPARGGPVEPVTDIGADIGPSHRRPNFLPDGKHFLFNSSLGGPATNGIYIGSLDKSKPVRISTDEDAGFFAPPNILLTIHQNNLQASRFDAGSGKILGDPVTVAQGVNSAGVYGASANGVLAYRTGTAQVRQLVWVDRQGKVLQDVSGPRSGSIAAPELSADEKSVSLFLHPGAGEDNDVWVFELARFLGHPITTGPPADAHAMWDPDGTAVIFNSARSGDRGPTRFPVAGGPPQILAPKEFAGGTALSITRDRRFLLIRSDTNGSTGVDLKAVSLPDQQVITVTDFTGDETEGQFSPDGKWVAYVASVSGRAEVYVQPFPDATAGRTQVSTTGGTQVRWSAEGREIYYVAPDGRLMAVSVTAGAPPQLKLPVALFQTHLANGNNVIGNKAQYAVSRDGRFLLNTVVEAPSAPIVVMVNWVSRLQSH
jgi:serine/threonine protein kinase